MIMHKTVTGYLDKCNLFLISAYIYPECRSSDQQQLSEEEKDNCIFCKWTSQAFNLSTKSDLRTKPNAANPDAE